MINLEKIKLEKCQPPPPSPPLRRPATAPYFHPFFNFSDSSQYLIFNPPPCKRVGGPHYDQDFGLNNIISVLLTFDNILYVLRQMF